MYQAVVQVWHSDWSSNEIFRLGLINQLESSDVTTYACAANNESLWEPGHGLQHRYWLYCGIKWRKKQLTANSWRFFMWSKWIMVSKEISEHWWMCCRMPGCIKMQSTYTALRNQVFELVMWMPWYKDIIGKQLLCSSVSGTWSRGESSTPRPNKFLITHLEP